MRRTGFLAAWVAAGLVAVLAFGGSPAYADPHGDKDKVDKELSQTQAALQDDTDEVTAAVAAYQEADRQLTIAQQRLADARGVLAGAEAREATTARVARTAQANLSVADQTLGVAQQKVDQSRDAIDDYSVGAYEGGDIAGVSALLSVTSPADFVAGLTYLDQVAEVQQSGLAASRTARIVARNQENVQAGAARTAADAEADAVAAVSQAATAEQDAAQESQQVTSLVAEKAAALTQAQSQRAATLARYQALQAESDRIAAEIRAQAHPGSPAATLRPGARLPMPVVGWKSSDFGMRYDPFYHVWQLHAGVDLAAPEGTPIWAAAAGPGRPGRLGRRVRQLHLHLSRPLPGPGLRDLLRPPVRDPGQRRAVGPAGAGDRAGRHHRGVHRRPSALRGPPQRHPGRPGAVAARLPLLNDFPIDGGDHARVAFRPAFDTALGR